MGKSKRLKFDFAVEDDEEVKDRKALKKSEQSSSDDEANEDLTLKIVEKALSKRKSGVVLGSQREPFDGAALDGGDRLGLEKKKKRKNKEKFECAVVKEEENVDLVNNPEEKIDFISPDSAETTDNVVLKKLLRGPRYFDPPDSSWGTCYNCGEEGHMAVNCKLPRRKKPCFVCGSLDHSRRQCPKGQDCYICNKGGHRAKDCPEKNKAKLRSSKACLRCGKSGHDMFTCRNDYSADDLKEIQCYICRNFGHLCCTKVVETSSGVISCYKCGQVGHTGLACKKLCAESNGDASPGSCHKCGEEGHFARECRNSTKSYSRFRNESSGAASLSSCYRCGENGHFARECTSYSAAFNKMHSETSCCYKCGEGGHFARECVTSARVYKWNEVSTPNTKSHWKQGEIKSAPNDFSKRHKRKNSQEESFTTPKRVKRRGGWIMDDPEDINAWEPHKNNWKSPSTPKSKGHKKSTFTSSGHSRWSRSKSYNYGSSMQEGSYMAYQNNYSASRFSNSNGGRRNYDWW